MHEAGIADRLVHAAVAAVEARGGRRITAIEVEAGPLAVPSTGALAFHFGLAAAGTLADGAELRVVEVPDELARVRLVAIDVED